MQFITAACIPFHPCHHAATFAIMPQTASGVAFSYPLRRRIFVMVDYHISDVKNNGLGPGRITRVSSRQTQETGG